VTGGSKRSGSRSSIPPDKSDAFYDMKFPLGTSKTRVLSGAGTFGRVAVARFRPGTDLITGIKEVGRKYKIRGGVVMCGFGSLQKSVLGYVRPTEEPHMRSGLDIVRLAGPVEFASTQGMISESKEKGLVVHLHGVVADRHGHCFAGHFIEGQNLTLANLEIAIGEVKGIKMGQKVEPQLGWELLDP
jgi:predicted DNA-binding protein with PD1-like motif